MLSVRPWCFALILAAATGVHAGAEPDHPSPGATPTQGEIDAVVSKVYPALVRIFVVTTYADQGRERKAQAAGSGVILTSDGYVVTNHHVAGVTKRIWCTLSNKEEVEADLVGTDALTDIAVIKLKPETMRSPVESFPAVEWGDSHELRVGDKVFAMGSPIAISQSVTFGIVSNAEMIFPDFLGGSEGLKLDGEPVGSLVKWLLHDAAILPGNSGGPLVNVRGQVVGINELGFGSLGGAIPSHIAQSIVSQLIESGTVRRSWVGLELQPLLQSDESDRGALIGGVIDDSPAAGAGLRAGDLLVSYNGRPIHARYREQLPGLNAMMFDTPIDSPVSLTVLRDGKEKSVKLRTVARGKARETDRELKSWGVTARDFTKLHALESRRETAEGVYVSSVRPGGAAGLAKPMLSRGDVITRVNERPIDSLNKLLELTTEIIQGESPQTPLLVHFERQQEEYVTVVTLGARDDAERTPEAAKAWFPAAVQVLTRPLAKALGRKDTTGVRITRVYPSQDAWPFQVGDILTHVDGVKIDASQPEHSRVFPAMVRRHRVGREVEFTTLRGNDEQAISIRLPARHRQSSEMPQHRDDTFEITARELSVWDRFEWKLAPDQPGVVLHQITPGGWADLAALKADDLVLAINDRQIGNLDEFKASLESLADTKPDFVRFFVKRGIHTLYTEVRTEWSP